MAKLPHQSSVPPVDPQDGAIKSDGGAAESLQTTTTDVVVATATAPTTGDVLTAINGVSADWQAPAAGSGGTGAPFSSGDFTDVGHPYAEIIDANGNGALDGMLDITVECWLHNTIDPNSRIQQGLIGKSTNAAGGFAWSFTLQNIGNGGLNATVSTDGTATTTVRRNPGVPFVANEWRHVAFTRDGTTGDIIIYVDGAQEGAVAASAAGAIFTGTGPFRLGNLTGGWWFQGYLAQGRVWNVVRTPAQIANNRIRTVPADGTGLVGLFGLDGDLDDSTANANNLVAVAGPITFSELIPHGVPTSSFVAKTGELIEVHGNAPTDGQVLTGDGTGNAGWEALPLGGGANAPLSSIDISSAGPYAEITSANDNGALDGMLDITFETWLYFTTDPTTRLISAIMDKGTYHSSQKSWGLATRNNGNVEVGISTLGNNLTLFQLAPPAAGLLNNWHHIAVTRNGTTGSIIVYYNGVAQGAPVTGLAGTIFASTSNFRLGQRSDGTTGSFGGYLSQSRLWNVVRTPAEVAAFMSRQIQPGAVGLVGSWPGDQDLQDKTINANHLTAVGALAYTTEVPFNVDHLAIHANSAFEINAITLKATPVATDVLVIEDSEAVFVKKKIELTDLLNSTAPIASAQGDYIKATMSADQLSIADGTTIGFDTLAASSGDLSLTGSTVIGFKAGRSYTIYASVVYADTIEFRASFEVFDVTSATQLILVSMRDSTSTLHNAEASIAVVHFRPTVDSSVEVRHINNTGADVDVGSFNSVFTVVEIGAVQADVVGGLEFMDVIEVTADTTSVSFGATGDGLHQRALDGDVDETYVCEFYFPDHGGLVSDIELRPNGLNTNMFSSRQFGGSTSGGNAQSPLLLVENMTTGYTYGGSFEFLAKSGKARTYTSQYHQYSVGNRNNINGGGTWTDEVTNITSLEVWSPNAGIFKPGTRLVLYRRTRSNLRADSASTYERMTTDMAETGGFFNVNRTLGHTIYGGSIVGLSVRVEDAVTAGSITVIVYVDGIATLVGVLDATNPTSVVLRAPIGEHRFAADKNVHVQFLPSNYDNAGTVPSPVTVQVHMTNDALITQNDRVVARTVLGANATTLSLTGLDGDLDGEYEITGSLIMTASAFDIDMGPNGDAANLKTMRVLDGGIGILDTAGLLVTSGASAGNIWKFRMTFWASRTQNGVATVRGFELSAAHQFDTGNQITRHSLSGTYRDSAANLTSIDFVCTTAGGILAGSEVVVRRVKA